MKQAVSQWWSQNKSRVVLREGGIAAVVVVNLVTRWILRVVDAEAQDEILPGVITLTATLLAALGWGLWQIRGQRAQELALYAITPIAVAGVLIGVLGPWVSGGDLVGFWITVGRSLSAAVVIYIGVMLGVAAGIAFEWDQRTRGLRAYARRRGGRR